jgi:hypothetical protein
MSPYPLSRGLRWAIGAGAGAIVTTVLMITVPAWTRPPDQPLPPGGDRIQTMAQTVESKHFWAGPEVATLISPAEVSQIQTEASASRIPLYIVYLDHENSDDGFYLADDGLEQLTAAVGRRGYYALIDRGGFVTTDAIGYQPPDSGELANSSRPATSIEQIVHQMATTPPEPPYANEGGEYFPFHDGVWTGILCGAAAGGIALGILALMRRRLGMRDLRALPTTRRSTPASSRSGKTSRNSRSTKRRRKLP